MVDGTDPLQIVRKIPGRLKYENIVLKRGFVESDDLWLWRRSVEAGTLDRKDGVIIITNPIGIELGRICFFNAWPYFWNVRELPDGTPQVIEEIGLATEGASRGASCP